MARYDQWRAIDEDDIGSCWPRTRPHRCSCASAPGGIAGPAEDR